MLPKLAGIKNKEDRIQGPAAKQAWTPRFTDSRERLLIGSRDGDPCGIPHCPLNQQPLLARVLQPSAETAGLSACCKG